MQGTGAIVLRSMNQGWIRFAVSRDRVRRIEVVRKGIGRCDINRMRPGIRRQSLQPLRQAPFELDLQCLVVRYRRIVRQGNLPKVRVRIEYVAYAKKVAPNRADIGQ